MSIELTGRLTTEGTRFFKQTWNKFMSPIFTDSMGKEHKLLYGNALTDIAQKHADKIKTIYRDKSGVQCEISLNRLTPEFILLNDYYFNEFRVDNDAEIVTTIDYHYP